jgi:hypothetical protein
MPMDHFRLFGTVPGGPPFGEWLPGDPAGGFDSEGCSVPLMSGAEVEVLVGASDGSKFNESSTGVVFFGKGVVI